MIIITFPAAGQNTEALLNAPKLPPLTVLAHSLINDLDQIDYSFILVLDDYHAIRAMRDPSKRNRRAISTSE